MFFRCNNIPKTCPRLDYLATLVDNLATSGDNLAELGYNLAELGDNLAELEDNLAEQIFLFQAFLEKGCADSGPLPNQFYQIHT